MTRRTAQPHPIPPSPPVSVRSDRPVAPSAGTQAVLPSARPRSKSAPAIPAAYFLVGGLAAATLFGLLLLAAMLGWYTYYQAGGLIAPGVRAVGVDLSGLTVENAAALLEQNWTSQPIAVSNGLTTHSLLSSELGLQLDARLTAQAAYQVGHAASLPTNMMQMISSQIKGSQVPPSVSLDLPAAQMTLESLQPALSQPAQEASLRLEGGQLVAVPGQLGYTINLPDTLSALAADPASALATGSLIVKLMPVAPAVSDATPYLAAAQQVLNNPPLITAYDAIRDEQVEIPVSQQEFAGWLAMQPGAESLQIGYKADGIAATLANLNVNLTDGRYLDAERLAPLLAQAAQAGQPLQADISYAATAYTVQPGDTLLRIGWNLGMPYWRIVQANPGLDPDSLPVGQTLVIPAKTDLLPLPVVPGKRVVISIEKQRLWAYENGELLAKEVISTGMDRSPTQPGVFQVMTRDPNAYASVWDLTMPNFIGIYEAWPGFMNGIHGLPVLANGQRLWANVLGQPASYGCIILDLPASEWFYEWAEDGVVVEIQP